MLCAAAALGPARLDLGQDPLAQLVARLRERERGVCVQALEPACPRLAADPAGQLGPQPALLLVPALEACPLLVVLARRAAPALDAAPMWPGSGCCTSL